MSVQSCTTYDATQGRPFTGRPAAMRNATNTATAGTPTCSVAAPDLASGARLVVHSVSASIACAATPQTPVLVQLLDSDLNVLWQQAFAALAGAGNRFEFAMLDIPLPKNKGATLAFAGALAAGVVGTVSLGCYDATGQ